jgi:putative transcriptional regulator
VAKKNKKKRNIEQELLDDLEAVKAHNRGEINLHTRTFIAVSPPAEIRRRLKLTQHTFAGMLGVSVRTIQDWEQGRREPGGPASALLRIADQAPDTFRKLR